MSHGPKARAKRQAARDARRTPRKPITSARIGRILETSSLSGASLGGRERNRRVPAYEIQRARSGGQAPAFVQQWMSAYSGGTSQRMSRTGRGAR